MDVKKYKLSYREAADFVAFVIERSFVDKGDVICYDALASETAKKLAFLKFYTDFEVAEGKAEEAYEEYRDLDVSILQTNFFGKEQYKTIMDAVDKQLEYELEVLYRSPEHCKTTLSIKGANDE